MIKKSNSAINFRFFYVRYVSRRNGKLARRWDNAVLDPAVAPKN